jgi:hypothetical protein
VRIENLNALDREQFAASQGFIRLIEMAVEVELHRLRVEWRAIMERDTLPQVEHVTAVIRLLP